MKLILINIRYKVVTNDMKSLGLRKNPNIIKYPLLRWYYLKNNQIKRNNKDFGGIWTCKTLSGARKLQNYMKIKYNKKVKIFKCIIDEILFENSYRTKTNAIKLLKKIKRKL